MGATPYSETKKNYYNVQGHQFTKRATEGQDGATMRKITKKDGSTKEVWEFLYRDLSGNLTGIEVKETDWGKQYEITLNDIGEEMVLQLNVDSGYGDTFANRILNIDVRQPVKLVPYSFTPEGEKRKKEGVNIFQGEVKVEPKYTKENPADMPSVEQLQAARVMSTPPESGDWKMFFGAIHKFFGNKVVEFSAKLKTGAGASEVKDKTVTSTPDPHGDLPFLHNTKYPFPA